MRLYENYIENIKNVISREKYLKDRESGKFYKSQESFSDFIGGSVELMDNSFSLKPLNSLTPLINHIDKVSFEDRRLGEHPDFKHLKNTRSRENHYITSAFIDIKNSTGLFRHYSPEAVMVITNTIQRAAIHTCVIFGGYIQRLQGDGVFVYFGGKNIGKKESSINALIATSLFTYFVKNDLKVLLEEQGIDEIFTRTGVDFGDDDKVVWAVAGIGECSEITTYSLHTSLASKMQAIANANGIVVGGNVKNTSVLDNKLFDWVKDSNGQIKQRYIFEDRKNGFYYPSYDFNWYQFLKELPFIKVEQNGQLRYFSVEEKKEEERLNKLKYTAALINSGNAYTNSSGRVSDNSSGVINQPHRFHYE